MTIEPADAEQAVATSDAGNISVMLSRKEMGSFCQVLE